MTRREGENRKSLKEVQGRVGTLVGVCGEGPTYMPRLTGCQPPRVSRKCECRLGELHLGSSSSRPRPRSLDV